LPKGLRYDLTVPFARFVVMNRHDLPMPFNVIRFNPFGVTDHSVDVTVNFISAMLTLWEQIPDLRG
jgi:hypothetical protein